MLRLMLIVGAALGGYALAETGTVLPVFDLAAWGASVLLFGKALELLTQFIKVRLSFVKLPNLLPGGTFLPNGAECASSTQKRRRATMAFKVPRRLVEG